MYGRVSHKRQTKQWKSKQKHELNREEKNANHNTSRTALSPIEIVCSFFSSNTSKRIASNKNLPKKTNTTALLLLWVCRAAPLNVYTSKRAWFFSLVFFLLLLALSHTHYFHKMSFRLKRFFFSASLLNNKSKLDWAWTCTRNLCMSKLSCAAC